MMVCKCYGLCSLTFGLTEGAELGMIRLLESSVPRISINDGLITVLYGLISRVLEAESSQLIQHIDITPFTIEPKVALGDLHHQIHHPA